MEHRKLNRIVALVIFAIGLAIYGRTVAPTTSYWDCGEFIACSYIMGVPHPPGSPFFILLGRVFSILPFFGDIGLRVNIISVIVSALTIMLTYLIIVRLIRAWRGIPETFEQKLILYMGGIIGALAFALSDSFWFNAVEAEVYAMSMFFTAFVVWLIMVWGEKSETPIGDKILLLIAYLVGLAIGVHLLNLLALPTVFLIIYFKKKEVNARSFLYFSLVAIGGFLTIYVGIIKGIPWMLNVLGSLELGEAILPVSILAIMFALFVAIYKTVHSNQRILSLVLMSIMLIMVGYSTYTVIYIRSNLDPVIDENDPEVPARFVSYLNREQYGDIPLFQRRAPLWEYQIKKMYIRYFGWQFIGTGNTYGPDNYIEETISLRGLFGLPFLIGLIGMFYHFQRDWKKASSILLLFIMTGIAIVFYLNQENPQPRERDYTYIGSFFAFALWVGVGASYILEFVSNTIRSSSALKKIGVGLTVVLLIVAVPYNMYSFNFHEHDRTGNYVPWDYSYNILQSCEPNAIIFTNGDNDTFPIWYLQYVEGIRPDVRVVNLSLLNTDWYIKQLRDEEPKVPIALSDKEVDDLMPSLLPGEQTTVTLSIKVPKERVLQYVEAEQDNSGMTPDQVPDNPQMVYKVSGTLLNGRAIRVQDIMIDHILRVNRFKKPVYFAVTVSPENMIGLNNPSNKKGLQNYLRMDGLAFKVMPYGRSGDFISPEILRKNLFTQFKYRNLDNPDVFIDRGTVGLLQNYRNAFFRLASYYQSQGKKEDLVAVLDKMNEVMPEDVIPIPNYRISLTMGQMYYGAGRPEELKKRLDEYAQVPGLSYLDKMTLVSMYTQYFDKDTKAESLAVSIVDENPNLAEAYGLLANYYMRNRNYVKALETMEKLQRLRPTNKQVQQQIVELRSMIEMQDSLKIGKPAGNGTGDGLEEKP